MSVSLKWNGFGRLNLMRVQCCAVKSEIDRLQTNWRMTLSLFSLHFLSFSFGSIDEFRRQHVDDDVFFFFGIRSNWNGLKFFEIGEAHNYKYMRKMTTKKEAKRQKKNKKTRATNENVVHRRAWGEAKCITKEKIKTKKMGANRSTFNFDHNLHCVCWPQTDKHITRNVCIRVVFSLVDSQLFTWNIIYRLNSFFFVFFVSFVLRLSSRGFLSVRFSELPDSPLFEIAKEQMLTLFVPWQRLIFIYLWPSLSDAISNFYAISIYFIFDFAKCKQTLWLNAAKMNGQETEIERNRKSMKNCPNGQSKMLKLMKIDYSIWFCPS